MVAVHRTDVPAPAAWSDLAGADYAGAGRARPVRGRLRARRARLVRRRARLRRRLLPRPARRNGAVQVSTPDDVTTGVAQGIYDAGMTTANSAYAAKDDGSPVDVVWPEPGAVAIYGPVALATHSADSRRREGLHLLRRRRGGPDGARRVRLLPDPAGRRRPDHPGRRPDRLPRLGRDRRRTRTRSSPSTSRSSAADRCRPAARRPLARAGARGRGRRPRRRPGRRSPLLRLGQVLWQETDGGRRRRRPRLPRPRRGGAEHRRPRRRGHRSPPCRSASPWPWSCGGRTCPAGPSGGSPSCCRSLVPDFVLGYSWTQAYARAGFTDTVLGLHWPGLLGPVGVWLVLVVNAAPLVYLVVAVGLAARAEPDLERAARVSGAGRRDGAASPSRSGWRCPAVAAAAVLVFVLTLGTFAIPQVLGAPAGFEHRDHPDLRRPLHRRRPGVLPRGGDPRAAARPGRRRLRRAGRRAARPAAADRRGRPTPQGGAGRRPGRRAVAAGPGRSRWAATSSSPWRCRWPPCVLSSVTRAARRAAHAGQLEPRPLPRRCSRRAPLEALGRSLGLAVVAASLLVLLGGLVAVARTPPGGPGDGDADHPHARAARLDARGRAADRLRPLAVRARSP